MQHSLIIILVKLVEKMQIYNAFFILEHLKKTSYLTGSAYHPKYYSILTMHLNRELNFKAHLSFNFSRSRIFWP